MLENLKNRRSIRKYQPEQISDAHLDAILEPSAATEDAFELLYRLCKISDEVKPVIMKAIYA